MVIRLPDDVEFILRRLKSYGSVGYIVGGCVRDYMLGKEPDDWDICTPLLPEIVKKLFSDYQVIETGIKHGTVTVVINDNQYEITTFRIDGKYSDGRHPDNVYFTDSLKQDLSRRDFTMNALAYSPDTGIIDYFNGVEDIENGIVRCVGDAKERFAEDPLRVLRALRFVCVLNFDIDIYSLYAANSYSKHLRNVSRERICSELSKMLKTKYPARLKQYMPHIWGVILNALLSTSAEIPVKASSQAISSLLYSRDDLILRLALIFQDYGIDVNSLMKSFRFDNVTTKAVCELVARKDEYRYTLLNCQDEFGYILRKYISTIGYDQTDRLLDYWKAIVEASYNIGRFSYLSSIDNMKKLLDDIKKRNDCCTIKNLDITGDDLIQIGYEEGESIGIVLKLLLDEVLKMPFANKKNWLVNWAEKHLTELKGKENAVQTDEGN